VLSSTIQHPIPIAVAGHLPLILLVAAILVVAFRRFQGRKGQDSANGSGDGHRDGDEE
jgi:hypothetical protein